MRLVLPVLLAAFMMTACKSEALSQNGTSSEQTSEEISDLKEAEDYFKGELTFSNTILVNQLGYLPKEKKRVIFRGDNIPDSFQVIEEATGKTVFSSHLMERKYDAASDEECAYGEFTALEQSGTYYIAAENVGRSYSFEVDEQLYQKSQIDALRFFYIQRCGLALEDEDAGIFARQACHTSQANITGTDQYIDVSGGWHEDGDYGRYVVTGAHAAAYLMMSYMYFPDMFGDDTGIPESGNQIPDILDEVRYEMEWMLKMQSESGGVFHKVTAKEIPDQIIAPEQDKNELFVAPVSNTATGDFSAVMAMFSKLYKEYDPGFASHCLRAAENAWIYLRNHPENNLFENPEGINTPAYEDENDLDERFWAAGELYKTTGKQIYESYLKNEIPMQTEPEFSWSNVSGFGYLAYLTTVFKTDIEQCNILMDGLLSYTAGILSKSQEDVYFTSLQSEYEENSNYKVAQNTGMLLIMNRLSISAEYQAAVSGHVAYLFGCNPMNMSYITGYGEKSPGSPYYKPVSILGQMLPGLLVSGPSKDLTDGVSLDLLKEMPPAKKYVDVDTSYDTNRVTIWSNAALVFLLSGMQ